MEPTLKYLQILSVKENVNIYLFSEQSEFQEWFPVMQKGAKIDCILVMGGDGTILRAVKYSLKYKAPLLGINLGHLGFLSESSLEELEKAIIDLKNNKYKINTFAEGTVSSAATLLFLAGNKRYMTENSFMLIHQLSGCLYGNYR
jgi:NAD kinase